VDPINVNSFWTLESTPYLSKIEFFNNPDCNKDPLIEHTFVPDQANTCVPIPGGIDNVQCVMLTRYIPGIWLFSYENGDPQNPEPDKGYYKVFQGDWAKLPDELRGKVRTIAIVPDTQKGVTYGTILHTQTGSRGENKGQAHLYLPPTPTLSQTRMDITTFTGSSEIESEDIGSITVFRTNPGASDRSITIFENSDYRCQPDGAGVCQDASIEYKWDDMEKIPGMDYEIARAIVLKERAMLHLGNFSADDINEWWEDGDELVICDYSVAFIGHIWWRTGGCFRGVSSIKFEDGSSYLVILYNSDTGAIANDGRGGVNGLIISGSVRNLGTYKFQERTGIIFVIKVLR